MILLLYVEGASGLTTGSARVFSGSGRDLTSVAVGLAIRQADYIADQMSKNGI